MKKQRKVLEGFFVVYSEECILWQDMLLCYERAGDVVINKIKRGESNGKKRIRSVKMEKDANEYRDKKKSGNAN